MAGQLAVLAAALFASRGLPAASECANCSSLTSGSVLLQAGRSHLARKRVLMDEEEEPAGLAQRAGFCCYWAPDMRDACTSCSSVAKPDNWCAQSEESCSQCGASVWCPSASGPQPTASPKPAPQPTPAPLPAGPQPSLPVPVPSPRPPAGAPGDRCESERLPKDSRCSGCPPMFDGKPCASTTRYNDMTKAACGCGNSDPVPSDWWTLTQATAALNCKNLDPGSPLLAWCPSGCGGCYRLCTTGGTTQGQPTEAGLCRTFKITNRCGDGFDRPNGRDWCSAHMSWQECAADPARCKQDGNTNWFGYPAHFDLQDYHHQISVLGWDNVEVTFEPVPCSGNWEGPEWDCYCKSTPGAELVQATA